MTRKRSPAEAEEPRVQDGGLRDAEPHGHPPLAGAGLDQQAPAQPEEREHEAGIAERAAQAEEQRDEYLDLLQRVQADFENFRKRAARDQERLIAHAHERIVRELLPVLDDLERTLAAAERHEEAALVEGVQLVERSLRKALEKEGLVEIEAEGIFDPHVHEAMLAQQRDGADPGTVLEVVQRGYRLGDRVIRPARVVVAE